MFTLVSQASMLSKLARVLAHEENNQSWNKVSLRIDKCEMRSGVEGIRRTVVDVRAERVHNIDIEGPGLPSEQFMVNYWGEGRSTWR